MDHVNNQDIERNLADREQTRKALARKLETLETRMRDNIEHVKESVRHSTDLKYQVAQRPWLMFGLAVVLGSVAGRLFMGNRQSSSARAGSRVEDIIRTGSDSTRKNFDALAAPINLDQYARQLSAIKNASLGALTSIVAELARYVVPAILTQIDKYSKSKNFTTTTDKIPEAGDQIQDRIRTSVQ